MRNPSLYVNEMLSQEMLSQTRVGLASPRLMTYTGSATSICMPKALATLANVVMTKSEVKRRPSVNVTPEGVKEDRGLLCDSP
jgi:hypothetical protein